MLYHFYQFQDDCLAPLRELADRARFADFPAIPGTPEAAAHWNAWMEMVTRFRLSHRRPDYGITSVPVDGEPTAVTERVALNLPFGKLLHFKKDTNARQPPVLVIAPLSGHFATLLRGTVEVLLRDNDVYITDWHNARDVPLEDGDFGLEDYVDYLIRFIEEIGPGNNLVAVCQPCVQALIAVAIMSQARHPATPTSMILMAGPVDVRESPTQVNDLANDKPIDWFRQNVISTVPARHPGAGRRVYPGFVQLSAFMAMNMDRHRKQHEKLYNHLVRGEFEEARKIKEFYDEYFAVLDLSAEFYLETIDRIFQKAELANGTCTHRGETVDPGAITRTALLTVEGGRDDICALGQTAAAHDLCRSLRPHLKRHHLQANVGHYGVFNGKRWEREIYPVVRNTILMME